MLINVRHLLMRKSAISAVISVVVLVAVLFTTMVWKAGHAKVYAWSRLKVEIKEDHSFPYWIYDEYVRWGDF